MKTINNLNTDKIDIVFGMTKFNYDITAAQNEDGTENLTFDDNSDADKFMNLYKSVK